MKWPTVGELGDAMLIYLNGSPLDRNDVNTCYACSYAALQILKDIEQEEAKEDSLDELVASAHLCPPHPTMNTCPVCGRSQ